MYPDVVRGYEVSDTRNFQGCLVGNAILPAFLAQLGMRRFHKPRRLVQLKST